MSTVLLQHQSPAPYCFGPITGPSPITKQSSDPLSIVAGGPSANTTNRTPSSAAMSVMTIRAANAILPECRTGIHMAYLLVFRLVFSRSHSAKIAALNPQICLCRHFLFDLRPTPPPSFPSTRGTRSSKGKFQSSASRISVLDVDARRLSSCHLTRRPLTSCHLSRGHPGYRATFPSWESAASGSPRATLFVMLASCRAVYGHGPPRAQPFS